VSPVVEAPSLPPSRMVALLPPVPPAIPVSNPRAVKLDTTIPPEARTAAAATEPRRPAKHHSRTLEGQEAGKNGAGSAPNAQQTAQNAPAPPEMTSIGQLSAANDNSSTEDRHKISTDIDSAESGLNGIKRPLNSDEQKTVALIRSYITRARDALKVDDLDGARTLITKAQQLLGELTKS